MKYASSFSIVAYKSKVVIIKLVAVFNNACFETRAKSFYEPFVCIIYLLLYNMFTQMSTINWLFLSFLIILLIIIKTMISL